MTLKESSAVLLLSNYIQTFNPKLKQHSKLDLGKQIIQVYVFSGIDHLKSLTAGKNLTIN